jgi:hypothetical protein
MQGINGQAQLRYYLAKKPLNKLIPTMVRQAHHERNQQLTVRPELVEGLIQNFLYYLLNQMLIGTP